MSNTGEIVLIILLYVLVLFMVWGIMRLSHLLDRYRIKYGFDREIEMKEMREPTDHKLDEREKRFKKRVFRD